MPNNLHLPHVPRIELEPRTARGNQVQHAVKSEEGLLKKLELRQSINIIRELGHGGMGSVYLAEWFGSAGFSKTVAVKAIKPEKLHDRRGIEMFVAEANLVADLVHPNICQVYALARHDEQFFIVMEYVNGLGLDAFFKLHSHKKKLPRREFSAFIASRVCRGLDYAHKKRGRDGRLLNIVHRDVTPSNIMIDWLGTVKLADFGVARAGELTGIRVITGKPNYMSPEQSRAEPVDARSDIFSLGACLYRALTGRGVFNAKTMAELYEQQKRRIKTPHEIDGTIPEELSNINMKALEAKPSARFQTAGDFGTALEEHMYRDKYGPTNEKLADYFPKHFPEINRDRIV